jgi:DNA-binding transcriptional LysR family regulator
MDLAALADFNLVATHGGFGRASRGSGRSKATLSRKVSELEKSLGVRLIDRGSRMLRLTDEGRALHARTQGPLADIAEAERSVGAAAAVPSGILRVSAPIVLAHVLLPRIAAHYVTTYPQVELEIVAEDRMVDPVEDDYDIIIRVDPGPDERLVGRRIMEDERVLVAPPSLKLPGEEPGQAVPNLAAVGRGASTGDIMWDIETSDGVRRIAPQFHLRCSSFLMIRDAVLAGAGVALMPKLLVKDELATGRLISWGTHVGAKVEIWALQNQRRLSSSKVRAFLDALASLAK